MNFTFIWSRFIILKVRNFMAIFGIVNFKFISMITKVSDYFKIKLVIKCPFYFGTTPINAVVMTVQSSLNFINLDV
jgi:hypothetical protein